MVFHLSILHRLMGFAEGTLGFSGRVQGHAV